MVFVATFGALSLISVEVANRAIDGSDDSDGDVSASRLADAILGEPGARWYSTVQCSNGHPDSDLLTPDDITRFGLGAEACDGNPPSDALVLGLDKLRNIAQGSVEADADNGHVDYEEARSSLQLDLAGHEFHVRTWPLLPDLESDMESGEKDPNLRVAYIGDYDTIVNGVPTSFVVDKLCGRTEFADRVDIWVDINNNGTTTTAFGVVFSVPLSLHTVEIRQHTAPVGALGATRVTASLPKTADWEWADAAEVAVEVSDTVRSLGGCTVSLAGITMTAAGTTPIYSTYAEHLETIFSGSASIKVYYDAYDGKGGKADEDGWNLAVETSLGIPLASDSNLNSRGWESVTILTPGAHVIKLKSLLGLTIAQSALNVVASAIAPFTPLGAGTIAYEPGESAIPEAAFLAALVDAFDPRVYDELYDDLQLPFELGGDVYPDLYDSVASDFAPRLVDGQGTLDPTDDVATLANYSVIVVGSAADHSDLNSVTFKNALAAWVDVGGFLLVLGSDAQAESWLEPIFFSALSTASGGLSTPDPSHALLRSPNSLDHASYSTEGVAWEFTHEEDADHFTHIIRVDSGDALALSEPGTLGNGTVLLTSFRPWNLQGEGSTGDCDPDALEAGCEALLFLHNALTMGYRELYVDFGPELPLASRVSTVTRVGLVYHDELDEEIQILLQVYVF